jgi:hypothetical protein
MKNRTTSYPRLVSILLVSLLAMTAPAARAQEKTPASPQAPVVAAPVMDQRALNILKEMSDTLAKAKTLRFQARSMVPVKGPGGVWINLYGTSQVVMQSPDKLFAVTAGDFAPYDFYYDGKTITSYAPDKNLYAVKDAPATIDAMIAEDYRAEGGSFPYADILVSQPYDVMTKNIISALYVGQSTIKPLAGQGEVKTEHLVFVNKNVEWQIWIDTVDHLPRLVSAT